MVMAAVADAVSDQLDELRAQLDDAFDEVDARIDRIERQLDLVSQMAAAQVTATSAAQSQVAETASLVQRVISTLDEATASVTEPSSSIEHDVVPELKSINDLVAELQRQLTVGLRESRASVEASLEELRQQVATLGHRTVTVDTTDLEDVTRRGALHNAADIANLRGGVESLSEVVRLQEKGIGELRSTLDWIKERLLLR